jgi:hypothetical protein
MRPSLIDFLTQGGRVTPDQVRDALRTQQYFGGSLLSNLVRLRVLDENQAADLFASWSGYPRADAEALREIPERVLRLVQPAVAGRRQVIPFRWDAQRLAVATSRVDNEPFFRELEKDLGIQVIPHAVLEDQILALLSHHYGIAAPGEKASEAAADENDVHAAVDLKSASPMLRALAEAANRSELGQAAVALGLAHGARRILLLSVHTDGLAVWYGGGDGIDPAGMGDVRLPLDAPSIFSPLLHSPTAYAGIVPDLPANRDLVRMLGGETPKRVLSIPILVRDRTVAALYADGGPGSAAILDRPAFELLAARLGMGLEIILLRRKILS